jgi:hypothetical protein
VLGFAAVLATELGAYLSVRAYKPADLIENTVVGASKADHYMTQKKIRPRE